MSRYSTKAQPYAKAIFSLAVEQHQVTKWQHTLDMLAAIGVECQKNQLLDNPKITMAQKIAFFAAGGEQLPEAANLIKLLAKRKKLELLPRIAASYRGLVLTHNNSLEVKISSAVQLEPKQKERLLALLQQRYHREIVLHCHMDPTLIGGAIIYVADIVIDGSIKGMLNRLKQNLLLKSVYART